MIDGWPKTTMESLPLFTLRRCLDIGNWLDATPRVFQASTRPAVYPSGQHLSDTKRWSSVRARLNLGHIKIPVPQA